MLRLSGLFLVAAFLVGVATAPTAVRAEQGAKAEAAKSSGSSKAGSVDEFEENRRAHMTKSKENNTKKAAE